VVIQLQEKEHDRFQRHGKDLSLKVDVNIREALCGFSRVIRTLDGRDIAVSTTYGRVLKHGAIMQVEGEGFPTYKDPFNKGRLLLVFNVIFPEAISPEAARKVSAALAKEASMRGPAGSVPADAEAVEMTEFDGQGQWKGGAEEQQSQPEEEENEDEDHGHAHFNGGPPQCAQQ